ncbi:hypothetical protein HYU12_04585 [Candidatus Woesearchaeota archaeon]|nr:hypothetical protein [Candidatus Woesearchaeota archaeon]
MELVIDATILFTSLIGTGVTKDIIFSGTVMLYAPEYLFDELEKHKERVRELSGLARSEFDMLLENLKLAIQLVPKQNFDSFLKEANAMVSDKDDTEYVALALSMNKLPIWSNDPDFKEQSAVKVFNTAELFKHLKSRGITL